MHIQNLTLFLPSLPSHVKHNDLSRVFQKYGVDYILLTTNDIDHQSWRCRSEPLSQSARIVFTTLAQAEKALATQHGRQIPILQPPVVLFLTTTQHSSISSQVSGNPRRVKLLPLDCTDIQLYELLRPFGPLAYVQLSACLGGVVQFWTEEDALRTEAAMKATFARSTKITLQAYEPRNLICGNLAASMDTEALKTRFEQAGSVVSAQVFPKERGRSNGHVSFATPEEAENAIRMFHGSLFETFTMTVRYKESPSSTSTTNLSQNQAVQTDEQSAQEIVCLQAEIVKLEDSLRKEQVNHQPEVVDLKKHIEVLTQQCMNQQGTTEENTGLRAEIATLKDRLKEQAAHGLDTSDFKNHIEALKQQRADAAVLWAQAEAEKLREKEIHQQEMDILTSRLEMLETKLRLLEINHRIVQQERGDWRRRFETANSQQGNHLHELNAVMAQLETLEENLRQSETSRQTMQDECDEWRHKFDVADARRKILELDYDSLRWQEAKRQEETRMREEAEARKQEEELKKKRDEEEVDRQWRAEEVRRQMAEENRKKEEQAREQQEAAARNAREKEKAAETRRKEDQKRAQEGKEKKEREEAASKAERKARSAWKECTVAEQRRCRERDNRWRSAWVSPDGYRSWTKAFALKRFLLLLDEFDKTYFSKSRPLTFENIPWPVCDDPKDLVIQDLDWGKVEAFFCYVREAYIDYNGLVERVHRMFHPDKWRSKRILETVYDPHLRLAIEKTGNIVAQAMTPLWRKTKGHVDS